MNLVDLVNKDYSNPKVAEFPDFRPGDTVLVGVKIVEGNKSRVQNFQGTVIAIDGGKSITGHFRVRKISEGYGVERVFPFHSPVLDSIKVINKGKSRRAKHYYLRERSGKSAKVAIDYDRK